MNITLVAAMDKNRVIGKDGKLPWHLPIDLEQFRKLTTSRPVVMGRKTWDSLPSKFKPLPGRLNVVLTRDKDFKEDGCRVVHSVAEAKKSISGYQEVMIIGGAKVYEEFLPYANKMYLTLIDAEVEGDTYFPKYIESDWEIVKKEAFNFDEKNKYSGHFVELKRKKSPPKL